MKTRIVSLAVLLALLMPLVSHADTSEEILDRRKELLYGKEFKELEQWAEELRDGRRASDTGRWELDHFYDLAPIAEEVGANPRLERKLRPIFEAWEKRYPESVTWRVFKGQMLVALAWYKRSSAYAPEVSERQWRGFAEYLTEAQVVLKEAMKLGVPDPGIYSIAMPVVMGLGWELDKDDPQANGDPQKVLYRRGVAIAPDYWPLHQRMAVALLPRWGGFPGDVEELADRAANGAEDSDGEGLYTIVAAMVLDYVRSTEYRRSFDFDPDRIKKGFEVLLKRSPEAERLRHRYAYTMGLHNDRATAAELFTHLDEYNPLWGTEYRYKIWKDWANDEGPYPGAGELCDAIRDDETEVALALIEDGDQVNMLSDYGSPPLYFAIEYQRYELAKALIEAGADVAFYEPTYETAMNMVLQHEDTRFLQLILENGYDPDTSWTNGWNSITRCAYNGFMEHMKVLMKYKPDIEYQLEKGHTPLMLAVLGKHPEMLRYLIEQGADIHYRHKTRTMASIARRNGSKECLQILLDLGVKEPKRGE